MPGFSRTLALRIGLAAAAAWLPTLAAGAATAAPWEDELRDQIQREADCKVAFLTQVVERVVGGRRTVVAKVHCEDGRAFDAVRRDDDEPFDLRLCGVPDAKSC